MIFVNTDTSSQTAGTCTTTSTNKRSSHLCENGLSRLQVDWNAFMPPKSLMANSWAPTSCCLKQTLKMYLTFKIIRIDINRDIRFDNHFVIHNKISDLFFFRRGGGRGGERKFFISLFILGTCLQAFWHGVLQGCNVLEGTWWCSRWQICIRHLQSRMHLLGAWIPQTPSGSDPPRCSNNAHDKENAQQKSIWSPNNSNNLRWN